MKLNIQNNWKIWNWTYKIIKHGNFYKKLIIDWFINLMYVCTKIGRTDLKKGKKIKRFIKKIGKKQKKWFTSKKIFW